ncbi:MAG: hypothetical protein P8X89_14860, partial [Reinekea sp.]
MDRMNFNSYDHFHYYNQTYQEGGQHTFQPETGQTSGGGAASGASWNYPGQSYQDFNVQAQIPYSPGPDWESALRTPQPMAMEDLIHGQIHQQDGQYSSHETGQTSAGGAASGSWWSQPTPGQLQPNQNFDFPAQIPPLPRPDWEYLQQSHQPNALENIIENEVPLLPSNAQPAVEAPQRKLPIKERFLASLEAFAQGLPLKDCSSSFRLANYIKDDGSMAQNGPGLLKQLTDDEKTLLEQAISARQAVKQPTNKAPVEERFLAGLDNYARGMPLINCSTTLRYKIYVSDTGYLNKDGEDVFSRLSSRDQTRVNDALFSRRLFHVKRSMENDSVKERFLEGLENYAQGVLLSECSKTLSYRKYVTDAGRLVKQRGEMLHKSLLPEDQNRVNQALADRRRWAAERISGDLPHFLVALEPYSHGMDLKECGKQSGLVMEADRYKKVERYFTPEGGLTPKGELLIENLSPDQQNDVWDKIRERRQRMDPSAQAPDLQWQLPEIPSSMSEMEMLAMRGMNQTAMVDPMQTETMVDPMQTETMVDPMQTEAMWASVWQMTGQAMPGTWGIPSESAEPPIPS